MILSFKNLTQPIRKSPNSNKLRSWSRVSRTCATRSKMRYATTSLSKNAWKLTNRRPWALTCDPWLLTWLEVRSTSRRFKLLCRSASSWSMMSLRNTRTQPTKRTSSASSHGETTTSATTFSRTALRLSNKCGIPRTWARTFPSLLSFTILLLKSDHLNRVNCEFNDHHSLELIICNHSELEKTLDAISNSSRWSKTIR